MHAEGLQASGLEGVQERSLDFRVAAQDVQAQWEVTKTVVWQFCLQVFAVCILCRSRTCGVVSLASGV